MDLGTRRPASARSPTTPVARSTSTSCAQPDPVGREQAASGPGPALHTASFHLDRLVAEGLLEVEFRRLTGRTGPGAGRPEQALPRADREFAVSLPPRRYDLVGDILAGRGARSAARARSTGRSAASAREEGLALGRSVAATGPRPRRAAGGGRGARRARATSRRWRRTRRDAAQLPVRHARPEHTQLVCGLNRDFVQGVVDGLERDRRAPPAWSPSRAGAASRCEPTGYERGVTPGACEGAATAS